MRCAKNLSKKHLQMIQTIYRIIKKSEETGSVCDRKHNRRLTVLSDDTPEDVRLSLLFCFIIIILLRSETSVAFKMNTLYSQYIIFVLLSFRRRCYG
jgi:hypothetical protein